MKIILTGTLVMLMTGVVQAATIYGVSLDTSALPLALGPYQLYFSLIDGSGVGDGSNTVNLSDFSCGGCPLGVQNLTDNSFFQDLFVPFNAGGIVTFLVTLTGNVDPIAPDTFQMSILDGVTNPLPTTDPFAAVLLAVFDQPAPILQSFGSDSGSPTPFPAPAVSEVPEPNSVVLVLAICAILAVRQASGRSLRKGKR